MPTASNPAHQCMGEEVAATAMAATAGWEAINKGAMVAAMEDGE